MQKLKYLILFSALSAGLLILFGPIVLPDNFQLPEISQSVQNKDVIIIFNSGGWGNTPLDKAKDFAPVVEGIQQTLNQLGYNSIVLPYQRTRENLLGKISGAKEFFNSFSNSSQDLAAKIEALNKNFPDKKIILAGLSNGGDFVSETYRKLSFKVQNSVYAITAGTPFWADNFKSNNILQLNNNGKDSLVEGNVKPLLSTALAAPFKWFWAKLNEQNISFSQVFQINGHDYSWNSPKISSVIVSFLDSKLSRSKSADGKEDLSSLTNYVNTH